MGDLTACQIEVRPWIVFACRNIDGRYYCDPVFEAVTEGRQDLPKHGSPHYSACGDLGHWLLYRLGCREPWLNRAEFQGWRIGKNLSLLCASAAGGMNPLAKKPLEGELVTPGDILVVSAHNTAQSHVMVVAAPSVLVTGDIAVGEYGQWSSMVGRPSGRLSTHYMTSTPLAIAGRPIDSILHLADVPLTALPADLGVYAADVAPRRVLRFRSGLDAMVGDDVGLVQAVTGAHIDTLFGSKTEIAVQHWQHDHGLVVDGVVGPKTWAVIDSYANPTTVE